jgi:hypothetical protein
MKITEDKTQAIYFSHWRKPVEAYLTLKGGNIPFVKNVKYLGVIFDMENSYRFYRHRGLSNIRQNLPPFEKWAIKR